MRHSKKVVLLVVALVSVLSGCTMNAPQYQPDFNIVNDLKDGNLKAVSVNEFSESSKNVNKISLRGNSMVSPYNNSYADYFEKALKDQLAQAALLDENSATSISGELIKNDVSAASFVTGTADLSARFIVSRDEQELYNNVHSIHHEWESSFVGAVAIPNAQTNYPVAVQKLLTDFLSNEQVQRILGDR